MASTTTVSSTDDVCLYFVAILIPPLAVFLRRGCHVDFWINVLLWILGWIPGVLHAWWVIAKSERTVVLIAAPVVAAPAPAFAPPPVAVPAAAAAPPPAHVVVPAA